MHVTVRKGSNLQDVVRESMNVWFCPVKSRSWRIIKDVKLFGVPRRCLKIFNRFRKGDLLVFHVFKPINGIVAICEVASEVFEAHSNIWGKNRYPLRVRIKFLPNLMRTESSPIPLGLLFGKSDEKEGVVVEPYLRNVWVKRLSTEQYKEILKLFSRQLSNTNAR